MAKFVPTPEELKEWVEWYEKHRTYSAVAARFGKSATIVSRVLKEYYSGTETSSRQESNDYIPPSETIPVEPAEPMYSKATYYYELMNFAKEYLNGALQDSE